MAADGLEDRGLCATGTQILDLAGRRVRYRDEGTGTPVLLIHGIGRSLEDWIEQHDLLAGRGYRVLSLDLAGYGESDRLPSTYSLPALADFVGEVIDAIGVTEPMHVVGNSLGGGVAMQMAARAPTRVRSLVLVDSAGFGREVAASVRLISIRPLGRLLLGKPSRASARRLERSLFSDPECVTNERVNLAFRLAQRPGGTEVFLDTAAALGNFRGARRPWREALMAAMTRQDTPILVVWGEQDRIFPSVHLDNARKTLPRSEVHLFPDTGHMPHIERAVELATLMMQFWISADNSSKTDS